MQKNFTKRPVRFLWYILNANRILKAITKIPVNSLCRLFLNTHSFITRTFIFTLVFFTITIRICSFSCTVCSISALLVAFLCAFGVSFSSKFNYPQSIIYHNKPEPCNFLKKGALKCPSPIRLSRSFGYNL